MPASGNCCMFSPVAIELIEGQDSLVLLALFAAAIAAEYAHKDLKAGVLVGLTLFKFQYHTRRCFVSHLEALAISDWFCDFCFGRGEPICLAHRLFWIGFLCAVNYRDECARMESYTESVPKGCQTFEA
jgi:hypothetical protein